MTRSQLSKGILTSQSQGGGSKKAGLAPTVGKHPFCMRLIQRKGVDHIATKPSSSSSLILPELYILSGNIDSVENIENGRIVGTTLDLKPFYMDLEDNIIHTLSNNNGAAQVINNGIIYGILDVNNTRIPCYWDANFVKHDLDMYYPFIGGVRAYGNVGYYNDGTNDIPFYGVNDFLKKLPLYTYTSGVAYSEEDNGGFIIGYVSNGTNEVPCYWDYNANLFDELPIGTYTSGVAYKNYSIYNIVGYVSNGTNEVPCYWNTTSDTIGDYVLNELPISTYTSGIAYSMYIAHIVGYVSNGTNEVPCYWNKINNNYVLYELPIGTYTSGVAYNIFNVIFIVGYVSNGTNEVPCFWNATNNILGDYVLNELPIGTYTSGIAYSIVENIIVGFVTNGSRDIPCKWTNIDGTFELILLITDETSSGKAYSIDSGKIYGYVNDGEKEYPCYYEDGTINVSKGYDGSSNISSSHNNITLLDQPTTYTTTHFYWNNYIPYELPVDNYSLVSIKSVFNEIIVGSVSDVPCYWENFQLNLLPINDYISGYASGIFNEIIVGSVGSLSSDEITTVPCYWENFQFNLLPINDYISGYAYGVFNGIIVGSVSSDEPHEYPCYWENFQLHLLPSDNSVYGSAYRISNRIIVGILYYDEEFINFANCYWKI